MAHDNADSLSNLGSHVRKRDRVEHQQPRAHADEPNIPLVDASSLHAALRPHRTKQRHPHAPRTPPQAEWGDPGELRHQSTTNPPPPAAYPDNQEARRAWAGTVHRTKQARTRKTETLPQPRHTPRRRIFSHIDLRLASRQSAPPHHERDSAATRKRIRTDERRLARKYTWRELAPSRMTRSPCSTTYAPSVLAAARRRTWTDMRAILVDTIGRIGRRFHEQATIRMRTLPCKQLISFGLAS